MPFTLIYCGGRKQQSITAPCWEDIVWAVKDLMPVIYHFAILDDPDHIDGNLYLQTRMITSDDCSKVSYILETRFCSTDGDAGQGFAHYQILTEAEQLVLHHFKQYFMGKSVDVTGWISQRILRKERCKNEQY